MAVMAPIWRAAQRINWRLVWDIVTSVGGLIAIAVMGITVLQRLEEIDRLDAIEEQRAREAYEECVDRNKRAAAAGDQLAKLASAHAADGSINAQKVWTDYLEQLRENPLPECVKPKK